MKKFFNWGKKFFSIVIVLVFLIAISNTVVFALGDSQTKQIMETIEKLQKRISSLETKVNKQDKIIQEQKSALERVGKVVPGIKEALAPIEPKVLIKKFILTGVNLFDPKDFEIVLSKYRNKELGMIALKKVAEELTKFYRSKGYITSLAYLPAQDISDNVVEFRIIEGRVGNIKISSSKHVKSKIIKRKLFVEEGEVLDYDKLEKSIKRINKQPNRQVKAVLLPGNSQGFSDIELKIEEQKPVDFYTYYNNKGTAYTTTGRFGLGGAHNNLTGHDDILSARAQMGENTDVFAFNLDYNIPITKYDTRLGAYGAYSHSDIGGQFDILSPEGEAAAYGVYLTHPLFDKDFAYPTAFNLATNLSLGFDSISVWNEILGNETSHDELRVFKIGLGFDEKDSLGRTFVSTEVRFAIADFLGSMGKYEASSSRSASDAGGEYTVYAGTAQRIIRLPFSSLLVNTFKGQVGPDSLVNSAQLTLGGTDTVRGYPESDYLADYGFFNRLEVRTPAFIFPKRMTVPFDKNKVLLRDAIQFISFIDFGKGYLKRPVVGEQRSKALLGVGFGLRLDFWEDLHASFDIGFPVATDTFNTEDPSDKTSSAAYVSVQYDF